MSFDLSGALGASKRLSRANGELSTLARALDQYQGSLQASWSGPDREQIDIAIAKIRAKIKRAQRQIDATCGSMNAGAAALKTKEDTERAEARARAIAGGGGGGGGW